MNWDRMGPFTPRMSEKNKFELFDIIDLIRR